MTKRTTRIAALIGLALASPSISEAGPDTAQAAHTAYLAAINSNNLERFLETVTDDVVFIAPGTPIMEGKAEVAPWVNRLLRCPFKRPGTSNRWSSWYPRIGRSSVMRLRRRIFRMALVRLLFLPATGSISTTAKMMASGGSLGISGRTQTPKFNRSACRSLQSVLDLPDRVDTAEAKDLTPARD